MSEDFQSIRVLRNNFDYDEHEDFEEGNVVSIFTNDGMFGTTYKGKITWIDTSYIEVDCSTEFKADLRKFDFKNIVQISKVTME